MSQVEIPILIEDEQWIPFYATELSAGADLRACIEEPLCIEAGKSAAVPTGVRLEIPPGYEVQIRPRSGLAAKSRITVLNAPGTIDADYRGEILVLLINLGQEPFIVEPRMRVAQMVVAPVVQAKFVPVEALAETKRGEGRFGHSGTN